MRGLYGSSPAGISKDIKEKIIGQEEVITVRPANLLEPGWEKGKNEIGATAQCEEDVLTYILFPQVALKFFEYSENRDTEALP